MIKRHQKLSTNFYFLVDKMTSLLKQHNSSLRSKPCLLCLVKTSHSHNICNDCVEDLPFIKAQCARCALPLPSNQTSCGECIREPPPFDRCVSPFKYAFPVDRFIQHLKYAGKRFYARTMAHFIHGSVVTIYSDKMLPELLIPVPLHQEKLRQRGFNQSECIAREMSRLTGIPVDTKLVSKSHETESQATLNKQQRKRNLKKAFQVRPCHHKYIALIDDVVTTRATTEVIAKELLNAGAERVDVWCVARTPKQN